MNIYTNSLLKMEIFLVVTDTWYWVGSSSKTYDHSIEFTLSKPTFVNHWILQNKSSDSNSIYEIIYI